MWWYLGVPLKGRTADDNILSITRLCMLLEHLFHQRCQLEGSPKEPERLSKSASTQCFLSSNVRLVLTSGRQAQPIIMMMRMTTTKSKAMQNTTHLARFFAVFLFKGHLAPSRVQNSFLACN